MGRAGAVVSEDNVQIESLGEGRVLVKVTEGNHAHTVTLDGRTATVVVRAIAVAHQVGFARAMQAEAARREVDRG